ncbi:MAG: GNAT family N-acetyltransferase [Chthoniobacterales bacterium]|nr:GNAT family N-acetyltransferase [Chthoniobacterales bacterium]
MRLTIERGAVDSADGRRLFAELWAEVDRIYGNEDPSGKELTGMEVPRALFVMARQRGETIGCGAIRPWSDQVAEVKRLYVSPAHRGRGVARQIMQALEQFARETRFSEIWLETGLRQHAAIRLYESLGYRRIAGFGDYKDDPLSVCYGRLLG